MNNKINMFITITGLRALKGSMIVRSILYQIML